MAGVSVVVRQPWPRGGLLVGWSSALIGWMIGIELVFDGLLSGARIFEVGLAMTALAGVFTLTGARAESVVDLRRDAGSARGAGPLTATSDEPPTLVGRR
jgi:hypothetical protein